MKSISILSLMAVAFMCSAPSAQAGDQERALIGGIVGGIIIGSVLADSDGDAHLSVGYSRHHPPSHPHGYWTWVSVKTWVPGYYESSCDRYGRSYRVWVPGHFTYTKEKVWVESDHGHGHYREHKRFYRGPHRHGGDYDRHPPRHGGYRRY